MKIFKRIFQHLKNNFLRYISIILAFSPFAIFYWKISSIYVVLVSVIIFISWAFIITFCHKAQQTVNAHQRSGTLTPKKALFLSLQIGLPIYWSWAIISIVPITSHYVWLLTGMPVSIISSIPLKEVSDITYNKVLFWVIQVVIYLSVLILGQLMAGILLRSFK